MNIKQNIFKVVFFVIAGFLIFNSCAEDEEIFPRVRLFQPVLNEDLYAINNTLVVNLGNMKEASTYLVEMSRDSFLTEAEYAFEIDTNYFVIDEALLGEELLWYTIYQIQVTALADTADFNSKPSFLGSVRTEKFPSNQGVPTIFDVTDNRARVFWTPTGKPITGIKVYDVNDLRLENVLLEFEVSADDQAEAMKIIAGLEASTSYQIAIFSGDEVRGWEIYTMKEALVSGDHVVDLTGFAADTIHLGDTLPSVMDGAVIMLEGGKIYTTGGYEFDKSVAFISGYSFTQALPKIDCSSNFKLADGANVGSVSFKSIYFSGDFGANYIFNIDKSGTIGELKYESCVIHSLRGITRMKGGEGELQKYTLIDCQVDSINGYGVCYVDKDTWAAGDILLQNSTFSKIQYFLASRSNTNSVTIESCTLSEVPDKGRQMFRWRGGDGKNDIVNGLKIYNTIVGHGWDMDAEELFDIKGFEGLPNTLIDVKNTYTTGDFVFGSDEIAGFPNFVYAGTAADLWEDPYFGFDFNIKDTGFAGKGDCGDPRWRVGL